jgi:hypothetical protein
MMDLRCKARLPFKASLLTPGDTDARPLQGFTCNLSATGVALIVPAHGEECRRLVDDGGTILLTLELPSGPVLMKAVPVHHQQPEVSGGHLVGVRVIDMSDEDCLRYVKHLRTLT